jgi:hypothetical protein
VRWRRVPGKIGTISELPIEETGGAEKEGSSDILGEETVQIPVYVPPHQTRAINATLNFGAAPKLTEYALTYAVIEIRGGIKYVSTDPTAGLTE